MCARLVCVATATCRNCAWTSDDSAAVCSIFATSDYGLRVMQRTIKRLSMAKERAALRQWKHIVDEMNRVQSLIETNRIQLWEGFTVLSKSVRRMTKVRNGRPRPHPSNRRLRWY